MRNIQNTKYTEPEKKVLLACNNQTLSIQNNDRILKVARGKRPSNIKTDPLELPEFSMETLKPEGHGQMFCKL